MKQLEDWKLKTLIIGTTIGTISGLLAAYIMIQRAEQRDEHPKLTAGEGVQLGLGMLGVLKLLANIGK